MTIPITSIVKNTSGSWTFSWSSDGSTFYRIVLFGKQIGSVTTLTYTWTGNGQSFKDFPPPLEISHEDTLVDSELYKPQLIMQWYGEPQALNYLVQQSTDGGTVWKTIYTVNEIGSWLYSYQTSVLLDKVTYRFRVVAVDKLNNQATPRLFTNYMVASPMPVDSLINIGYTKPNVVVSLK